MLLIPCPWCGEREETEFRCGGEAHITRPPQPSAFSDAQWADYLFMRKNPKGLHHERWCHAHGCGRWFNLARDTITDRIRGVYRMGEQPPELDRPQAGSARRSPPRRLSAVTSAGEETS